MKYKILYTVDLLFSWEKRSAAIEVDLSDEEVEQIRSVVKIGDTKNTYLALKDRYRDLYDKLFDAGLGFMWYTVNLDIRISGQWEEIAEREINEKALMKEDIDCNGFDPHDKDGKLLRGQNRHNAWIKWEEEHLNDLPFNERSHYYQRRYDINDVNYEGVDCAIEFPSEIIDHEIERQKKQKQEAKEFPVSFIVDYGKGEDKSLKETFDVSLTAKDIKRIKEIVLKGHQEDDDDDEDDIVHISNMTDEELEEYFNDLDGKEGEQDNNIYDYEDEDEETASEELNDTIGGFYELLQDTIDSVLVLLDTDDIADKRKDITEHNVKLLNKISRKLNELEFY